MADGVCGLKGRDSLSCERWPHHRRWDQGAGPVRMAPCVIARINRERGACPTFTFDHKAAKGEGFRLLTIDSM